MAKGKDETKEGANATNIAPADEQKAKADAEKAKAEAEKAKADAEKAKADAEKAKAAPANAPKTKTDFPTKEQKAQAKELLGKGKGQIFVNEKGEFFSSENRAALSVGNKKDGYALAFESK